MKKLIYTAVLTLAIGSSAPVAFAGGVMRDAKAPHIVNSAAIPNNARAFSATHYFKIHVQGSDISQLSIDLPEGINVKRGIEITDQSGQKIDATVAINDRRATVDFTQPVPDGTTLSVAMKDVQTPFSLQGFPLNYPVYSRSVGMTTDVRLGMARIQTYTD